jgi:hypothetical protein
VSTDLSPRSFFVDVLTGEQLPATHENAYAALSKIAEMEARIRTLKSAITEYVQEETKRLGTKTLNVPGGKVVLEGGPEKQVEGHELAQLLADAGMPQERIKEVVHEEVTYKVDRRVLNQMAASNPDYKAAADLVTSEVEKPFRAKAK